MHHWETALERTSHLKQSSSKRYWRHSTARHILINTAIIVPHLYWTAGHKNPYYAFWL
ncbi:hypothetical protein PISMIDRAFT_680321, partial [Pisolithus microcarpus 441]